MSAVVTMPTIGHRMSSLPVVQYCGRAGELGQMGAGRAAAQSSAFHALCAKSDNADELCSRLTDDEYREILQWRKPGDVDLGKGRVLLYSKAEKELAVALDASGSYVDPSSPDAVTIGHFDFGWVVEMHGVKLAYVADIKRSEYTVAEGVDSLQLHAYGLAYATKHTCDGYVVGIWAAIEGQWQWSEIIDLETRDAADIARRVVRAATNSSREFAMGPHCRKCYGRFRCPAWLIPPELAQSSIGALTEGGELTDEKAAELLLLIQRDEDTRDQVLKSLKDYAGQRGGIRHGGKVWKPVMCQGRETLSAELLKKTFGADALAPCITRGKAYERFGWVNDRRRP